MSLFCATCKLSSSPENDATGRALPSCGCDDPRPVRLRFDPVRWQLTYSAREAASDFAPSIVVAEPEAPPAEPEQMELAP